jgi:hypothetical protein
MAKANGYVLTEKIPVEQKFRGQAALIHGFLKAAGDQPRTVAEQVAAIEKDLTTRQDPTRVVSFYMSVWKKKGWVRPVGVEVPDEIAAADKSDEPFNDHDAGIGMSPDERIAAQLEAAVEEAHIDAKRAILPDMKLSDACLIMVQDVKRRVTPEALVDLLNDVGYATELKRVKSAMNNLAQRGVVEKRGNEYSATS